MAKANLTIKASAGKYIASGFKRIFGRGRIAAFALAFFIFSGISAQEPVVSASVDSSRIKIGEQLIYSLEVETAPDDLVVFPEGQTFAPLEMLEYTDTDTIRRDDRFSLLKRYRLTQFDSGSYTIPRQRILVNDRPFFSDSLQVEVATVVVDTTKQKMFDIKPMVAAPASFEFPQWLWWVLALLTVGAAIWYFLRRKKKKEAAKKLPPFERALFELEQLDQSHLLENRQTKEYYSKLTEAVRRYLEDEVNLRAMESTSSELISYLEKKMETGELNLSRKTVDDLKITLQRADMAKFANSKPDIITAKQDRSRVENVIKDTKAAIPEPDEEQLLKDEAYREQQLQKRRRRKIAISVAAGLGVILLGISGLVATRGYSATKEILLGSSTKDMLQGEWITSEYGQPSVSVSTPNVLKRGEIDMPDEAKAMLVGNETFLDGSLEEEFYVVLSTLQFQKEMKFDLKTAVEGIYSNLEQKGAHSIIMKDEEFVTSEGAKGVKVYGSLVLREPGKDSGRSKEYMILNFGEKGGFQQLTLIYDQDDPYTAEIADRISDSVKFVNTTN